MKKSLSDLIHKGWSYNTSTPSSPKLARTTVDNDADINFELQKTSAILNYPYSITSAHSPLDKMKSSISESQLSNSSGASLHVHLGKEGGLTSDHEEYKKAFADVGNDQVTYQYYSDDDIGPILIILALCPKPSGHHLCYVMTKMVHTV
jgi:hypothetical protein